MDPIPSPALPAAEPAPEERARRLARELDEAFRARARLYRELDRTLTEEFGEAAAERLLSRAIERRGAEAGRALLAGTPPDPLAVATAFLTRASPDWGRLFPHEVSRGADGRVSVSVLRCPLKDAWVEAGLPGPEVERLCRIAGRADHGVFGASGCRFSAETWREGREGCCVLTLSPP